MAQPRKTQVPKPDPKAGLAAKVDFDQFVGLMFAAGESDETLKRVGVTRPRLRALLEQDDDITAVTETRRDAVLSTAWRLEPDAGRTTEEILAGALEPVRAEIAEAWRVTRPIGEAPIDFVWRVLDQYYDEIARSLWLAVPYGYSVVELVYGNADGRVVIADVEEKPMEWFSLDRGNRWIITRSAGNELADTVFKFHPALREASYKKPLGDALYSRLYWPWFFRTNGWKFWAKFLERYGIPFLYGKTAGDPAKLAEVLAAAANEASLATPDTDSVQILGASTGSGNFEAFETAVLKRYQRLVLGQTLTSDITSGGSYAAAKVHESVRGDRKKADLRALSPVVQRVVEALWALNAFPGRCPRFIAEDGVGLETERADRDVKLAQIGVKPTEQYILRAYDFEVGDFTITEPVKPEPGAKPAFSAMQFAAVKKPLWPDQDAIDKTAVDLLADAEGNQAMMAKTLAPVLKMLRDGESLEGVQQELAVRFSTLDAGKLENLLARVLFVAQVWGRLNA